MSLFLLHDAFLQVFLSVLGLNGTTPGRCLMTLVKIAPPAISPSLTFLTWRGDTCLLVYRLSPLEQEKAWVHLVHWCIPRAITILGTFWALNKCMLMEKWNTNSSNSTTNKGFPNILIQNKTPFTQGTHYSSYCSTYTSTKIGYNSWYYFKSFNFNFICVEQKKKMKVKERWNFQRIFFFYCDWTLLHQRFHWRD